MACATQNSATQVIALGIGCFVMLLASEQSVCEVIPFPKNQQAVELTIITPVHR